MLVRRIESDPGVNALLMAGKTATPAPRRKRVMALEGQVNLNPRGFAFVTTAEGEAYFTKAPLARFLLTGDRVKFVPNEGASEGLEVRSLLTVTRAAQVLLCEVHQVAELVQLMPDEPCFFRLELTPEDAKACVPGEVVAVHIPAYEGPPVGRPMRVALRSKLGLRSRPGFDLDYAMVRYGFDETIPAAVEQEALATVPKGESMAPPDDPVPYVTIDGESTRDLDDAVFAERLPQGGWRVKVAIADVSWYVRPDSNLDAWAAGRCTSVYLPGKTLPMLPEYLATDECSLTPGAPKRAVVMTLVLDADGHVLSSKVGRAHITSAARLSYNQVAAYMAGKEVRFSGDVEANLGALSEVYACLARIRDESGRLSFDEPEPTLVKGEGGTWQVRWEARTEAHKLVEELMLLANQAAAKLLVARYGAGVFRHQPPPEPSSWLRLRDWARASDFELPEEPSLRAMAEMVAAQETPEGQAAAALKVQFSMRPARYVVLDETAAGGHFSLSMDWYTHFTSPIRRYADLLVHRLLLAPEESKLTEADWRQLTAKVEQCSLRAQASRFAERLVWDRIKLSGFIQETAKDTAVKAKVVRSTARGLRVVLSGWQTSAWLPGANLRANGYAWSETEQVWASAGVDRTALLQEGSILPVVWTTVLTERPAYPELNVAFASTPASRA